eukprot:scaffold496962_cov11-Prasinocladus_malaysianus.AAC.1
MPLLGITSLSWGFKPKKDVPLVCKGSLDTSLSSQNVGQNGMRRLWSTMADRTVATDTRNP